VLETCIFSVSS